MLEELMLRIGYQEEEIKTIQKIYPKRYYQESTLSYNMKQLLEYFKRNTLNNQDFITITMTIPTLLSSSIENIKMKIEDFHQLGFHKIHTFEMIKKYPYLLELSTQNMKEKIDFLEELGFSKNTVFSILIKYPQIFRMEESLLRSQNEFLMQYGYSKKDVLHILEEVPSLWEEKEESLKSSLEKYRKMGFHKNEIIKITTILPTLFLPQTSSLEEKWKTLLKWGYTDIDMIQMIKKVPILLKENVLEELSSKLEYFKTLGIKKEDIILMTCNNPYLFLYSNETLQIKYQGFKKLFPKNANAILIHHPILLGYGYSSLEEKVTFYQKIKVSPSLWEETPILTLSLNDVKAKYYFMNKHLEEQDFFLDDQTFCKKYHITKKELREEEKNGHFN